MTKTLALLLLLPLISIAQKDNTCTIKGHIDGLGNDKLVFHHLVDTSRVFYHGEKIKAHHGDFVFKTHLSGPTYYMVHYRGHTKESKTKHIGTEVFLEKGNMTMYGSLDSFANAKVTGSPVTDEWKMVMRNHQLKYDSLVRTAKAADRSNDTTKKPWDYLAKDDFRALSEHYRQYIISHPASYVSLELLHRQYGYDTNPAESKPLYDGLDERLKNTVAGKVFRHILDKALLTDTGRMAPEFTLPDANGKKIGLSSFRGRVTLLDFWSSWCGPCRHENPNLLKAYKGYHDKGFEIYGVSLDANKTAWKNAVAKDSITWTQVSDLKGWKSAAAQLYGISGIPSNVLIDRNGMIIAKNLRGLELEKKLGEILK